MSSAVQLCDVHRQYENGLVSAVNGVNLQLEEGKIYALMGSSGCGKSTLLNMIGTLDAPTQGRILYADKPIAKGSSLHEFRRKYLGFVFQFHHLIPVLTLRENVEAAMLPNSRISRSVRMRRASDMLAELGVGHRLNAYASTLSGGERQRGAIARALINGPRIVLADEPTGNVDSTSAAVILKLLRRIVLKSQTTMLIATHDQAVADVADEVIHMQDGRIVSVGC